MKKHTLTLLMVILTLSSMFCQTPKVWTEKRGDSIVYVMTESHAKEISSKLIDFKASSDSINVLLQMIDQYDLIQKNLQAELNVQRTKNNHCTEIVEMQQKQIDNHIAIEDELGAQIKSHKRRKWLYAGGGFLLGLVGGLIL